MRSRSLIILMLIVSLGSVVLAEEYHRPSNQEFDRLIKKLARAMGTEKVIVIQQMADYYDPRFIEPLVRAIDDMISDQCMQAIGNQIRRYGILAEDPLIRFLQESNVNPRKHDVIDWLVEQKSTKLPRLLLELLNEDPPKPLRKTMTIAMLRIGDQAVSILADLLKDEELRYQARLHLLNVVSIDGLEEEFRRRGIEIPAMSPVQAIGAEGHQKRVQQLVNELEGQLLGKDSMEKTKRSRSQINTNLVQSVIAEKNPFLIAAIVLFLILFIFVFQQLVVPRFFSRRKLENRIQQIQKMIQKEKWEEALRRLEDLSVGHVDEEYLTMRKKEMRSQILIDRAESYLKAGKFSLAQKDYENYCNLTGKDIELFQHRIRDHRVDYFTQQTEKNIADGLIDEAISDAQNLLREDYGIAHGHFLLGIAHLRKQMYREAMEEMEMARNYSEVPSADIENYLAHCLAKSGDYPRAISVLMASLERNPSFISAVLFAQFSIESGGPFDEARDYLEKCLDESQEVSVRGPNSLVEQIKSRVDYHCPLFDGDENNMRATAHFYLGRVYALDGINEDRAEAELAKARKMGYQD